MVRGVTFPHQFDMAAIMKAAPIALMHALFAKLAAASPLEMTTADRLCTTFQPPPPRFCLGQRGGADYHEARRQQRCVAAT
jgi:hypothetical protein